MRSSRKDIVFTVLLGLFAGLVMPVYAQSSPDYGRVISSTPITDPGSAASASESRIVGYTVEYEFGGRRYSTQTLQLPGATIPVQVSAMGVMTTSTSRNEPTAQETLSPWQNVIPEPGVVVSGTRTAPQATYVAPTYVDTTPVYATPYGYAPSFYPTPFYAPIGLSLNFGYSRGWGGGYRRWR